MMIIDINNIRRLDLTLLIVLRDLIRHRKTTRVADNLGLGQSAISHSLARLRDIFGDPLFVRRPDGLEPTDRALRLLPVIDQVLSLVEQAVRDDHSFDPANARRTFRIAANDYVSSLIAPPLIAALAAKAPAARLSIDFAVGAQAVERLRRHEIDLAIGRFDLMADDVETRFLFDESFVTIMGPTHPLRHRPLDLAGFLAEDHVLVSFQGGFSGFVDTALAKINRQRRIVASVPLFMSAIALVGQTHLIATIPARLARKQAALFGLVVKPTPLDLPNFALYALRHHRTAHDQATDWLAAMVQTVVQEISA